MNESVGLMGLMLDNLDENQVTERILDGAASGRGGWVITPNVDILRQLVDDPGLMELARRADLAITDGMPLVWASRLQGTPLVERVAGRQLMWTVCRAATGRGASIYLLGGESGVAVEAAEALTREIPNLRVVGTHCPPHGFERDERCMEAIFTELERTQPDVVFCGLGFPKQERLMSLLAARFESMWFMGCGGSLTMAAGRVRSAPKVIQKLGLEWMFRLVQEPRRLFARYVVHDLPFAVRLLVEAVRTRRSEPPTRVIRSEHGSGVELTAAGGRPGSIP